MSALYSPTGTVGENGIKLIWPNDKLQYRLVDFGTLNELTWGKVSTPKGFKFTRILPAPMDNETCWMEFWVLHKPELLIRYSELSPITASSVVALITNCYVPRPLAFYRTLTPDYRRFLAIPAICILSIKFSSWWFFMKLPCLLSTACVTSSILVDFLVHWAYYAET